MIYLKILQIDNNLVLVNNGAYLTANTDYCLIRGENYTNDGEVHAVICHHETFAEKYKLLPIGIYFVLLLIIDFFIIEFFTAMILSIPFLILTLFVYLFLPEIRSTLNGKCVFSYVATLIVFYTFLAGIQLNDGNSIHPILCYTVAFVIYGAHFSLFLWVAVISFDIWWTFGYTI